MNINSYQSLYLNDSIIKVFNRFLPDRKFYDSFIKVGQN